MVDGTGGHVAVDGQLFAGHPVEGKARADLGHPRGTLGDHDEIHDQQNQKHDQPDQNAAAHDEVGEAFDHVSGGVGALVPLSDDEFGRRHVQRQPQHQRGQQNHRKGRKVQRSFDEQGYGEHEDGKREGHRQSDVQNKGGNRQDHHDDDRH